MKLMQFSEINDLENGQVISALQGRVTKMFDQLTGDGQYGTWWLQSFLLQDDHANEIKVTWSGEDPFGHEYQGKTILIESGRDKKDQLSGIKKEIKNKNGKHYECVKVDDRAKIKIVDSASENHQEAPANTPEPSPTQQNGDAGVTDARRHIMQSANLYALCIAAVEKYVAGLLPEIARTSEMFQAATGTLFIEASRAGFVQKMPTKPIQ
jgi:hypothetical protein